tara:strand:- start:57 stop:236 length:180 start_codon:yes stop_codon:yes gene_type:complete
VATQFHVAAGPMGGVIPLGLDYAGARAGLELAGIETTPALWADLRVVEAGALEAMREER